MASLNILYAHRNVHNKRLSKAETREPPTVLFKGEPGKQYSLIMYDPDAVQPPWLHWLVVNLSGQIPNLKQGTSIVSYAPPSPPPKTGEHRYIFTLYEQTSGSLLPMEISSRGSFPLDTFVQQNHLKPVASRQFRVPSA